MKNELSKPDLIKKLDQVFSEYIRLRDSDDRGFCRCVTCGKTGYWKNMQNGHFVSRGNMNTRFNPVNCNVQCPDCNELKSGNIPRYTEYLAAKYGKGTPELLKIAGNKAISFSIYELKEKISDYRLKVKLLKKDKL